MKTNNIAPTIQLNETFMRLMTGTVTIETVAAEHREARAARLAVADSNIRRRIETEELAAAFTASYCY